MGSNEATDGQVLLLQFSSMLSSRNLARLVCQTLNLVDRYSGQPGLYSFLNNPRI